MPRRHEIFPVLVDIATAAAVLFLKNSQHLARRQAVHEVFGTDDRHSLFSCPVLCREQLSECFPLADKYFPVELAF